MRLQFPKEAFGACDFSTFVCAAPVSGCSRLINLAGMIEGPSLQIAAGKRCCAARVIYVDMLMRPGECVPKQMSLFICILAQNQQQHTCINAHAFCICMCPPGVLLCAQGLGCDSLNGPRLLPLSEILFICANQMGVLRGCQTGNEVPSSAAAWAGPEKCAFSIAFVSIV